MLLSAWAPSAYRWPDSILAIYGSFVGVRPWGHPVRTVAAPKRIALFFEEVVMVPPPNFVFREMCMSFRCWGHTQKTAWRRSVDQKLSANPENKYGPAWVNIIGTPALRGLQNGYHLLHNGIDPSTMTPHTKICTYHRWKHSTIRVCKVPW